MKQLTLYEELGKNESWEYHWDDMPEYNNDEVIKPEKIATFKFRTESDYIEFMKIVKKELYNGNRVFDGMQKKDEKTAWFPLDNRPSEYVYVIYPFNEGEEYFVIENGEIISSIWDEQSEELFNINTRYFKNKEEALNSLKNN